MDRGCGVRPDLQHILEHAIMLDLPTYLIVGIGTDIGKTYLTTNLCRQNKKIHAIKPVITGFSNDGKSDSALILEAMGLKNNKSNLDEISPWRFEKPISANFAGEIKYGDLLKFCSAKIEEKIKLQSTLLIEGAGGLMSPITAKKTFVNLAQDLDLPIILVTANYLGSISHTLCALEVIKNKKLKISYIVVNELNKGPISNSEFIKCLKNFSDCKIFELNNFVKKS